MGTKAERWTRDDLPRPDAIRFVTDDVALDLVVDHLNAHYPKPQPYDQGGVRGADSLLYRAERERDAAVARADNLDKQLAKVMSDYQDVEDERDEKAEARTAAAVTRADVERLVHRYIDGGFDELHASRVKSTTDAFMALLSGDDPAVHVVRESDIAAVEVERGARNWIADGEAVSGVANGPDWVREPIDAYLSWVAQAEAVALAIEAEQAEDPVEAKARVEADRRYSGTSHHAFIEGAVWAARHLNEQEAGDE